MSSSTPNAPPPLKMIARSKKAVELIEFPSTSSPETKRTILSPTSSTFHSLSADGSRALIHIPSVGIIVRNLDEPDSSPASDSPVAFLLGTEKVQCGYWSPRGTYIVTWERPVKTSDGSAPPPNLKIWSGLDGTFLQGFNCKPFPTKLSSQNQQQATYVQWSPLQWSTDEELLFHCVTNEIHVYPGTVSSSDFRYEYKIRVPNITMVSVSRTHLLCFTPELKGAPARVSLHQHTPGHIANIASKSFYQTEECAIMWNPAGNACLALTQTTVDTTGESYYGSSNLFLVSTSGVTPVPLPNKDQSPLIQDVAWNPHPTKPSCFALISGKMPAMLSLHRGDNAQPSFLFGECHRNVISWSPHGRFVAFGGFGNLAGNVDIWDRNKLKICGSLKVGTAAVGWGWGADSRVFGISVTTPRMNVENGIRLFKYHGEKAWDDGGQYLPNQLLQAEFLPRKWGVYEDRPQSPERRALTPQSSFSDRNEEKKSTGAYVPPAARRAAGRGKSLAERMRKEKEEKTAGAMRVNSKNAASVPGSSRKIPGSSAPPEKSKSAKARERQKAAKQKALEEEKRMALLKEEQERKAKQEKEAEAKANVDPEKRAKKIKKTLKQIADLKSKERSDLNEDQLNKIATEDELMKELEGLGL